MDMQIDKEVQKIESELLTWRRHLHQCPELSFTEYETTKYIREILSQLPGVSVNHPTKTGVVGLLRGTKPGKPATIGIRADIDALPLQEETGLPFASVIPGVMHACGHDGHTAILLALAKLLSEYPEKFCGEVRLIFQHAEELPPGGAIEMLKAGVSKGVDAMLGLHLSSNWRTGVFGIKSGVLTSAVDRFDIHITGKGGHCAFPEQCQDPIVAMAQTIIALQTIVSRSLAATDPAVVSVCIANAGIAYNIIPDSARLTASVRSFSEETRRKIEREVIKIAEGVAHSTGTVCNVNYERGYPSVINNPKLAEAAKSTLLKRFDPEMVEEIGVLMPGEDFSYFLNDAPGFFVELGTKNKIKRADMPHHNSLYVMDEDALVFGVQYFYDIVQTLLDGSHHYL